MDDLQLRIPTLFVLAVLLAIFVSLEKKRSSVRVRLWLIGWGLVFLHFTLEMFPAHALAGPVIRAFDFASWQMAGIVFLVSVSEVAERGRLRAGLAALLGAPTAIYSAALAMQLQSPWFYLAAVALVFFGGAAWMLNIFRRLTRFVAAMTGAMAALGAFCLYRVAQGSLLLGFYVMLGSFFAATGVFLFYRYRRFSPGVVTTALGFWCWSAVFPFAHLWEHLPPEKIAGIGLWQVPTYLVAIGMIVTLLEDEALKVQAAADRERAVKLQMQRFAALTSRLLSGAEVLPLCGDIARTITEATSFRRAAVRLVNDDQRPFLAGSHGIASDAAETLKPADPPLAMHDIVEICAQSQLIGKNSFRCAEKIAAGLPLLHSDREYPPNSSWARGDMLIIPLHSRRGAYLGWVVADEPRDPAQLSAEDLTALEMLAGDLAIAIENEQLRRQLIISEKLAGIGQLVAGVAHELNNPLTAVLGFSEVLTDRAVDDRMRHELVTIHREAGRMKRIIQNLLRFARQTPSGPRNAALDAVVHEVLALRVYDARHRGIDIVADLPADLPRVAADESELKQVLFNLLTNAIDAVEASPEKRVTFEARHTGDRVRLRVLDTGPGFTNVQRAFDPFFTTKEIGKGTGLGLSICYGILKQHGGDIRCYNLQPRGACVALELPVAPAESLGKPAEREQARPPNVASA